VVSVYGYDVFSRDVPRGYGVIHVPITPGRLVVTTRAALSENSEASAELTTANGGTFTSCSARLGSQSRYISLDQ